MGLFIFRFWPVLIPLLVYVAWHLYVIRKAKKNNAPLPKFRNGPWFWIILASLLIGFLCFILIAMNTTSEKGEYIPPHLENGVLVPGQVQHE